MFDDASVFVLGMHTVTAVDKSTGQQRWSVSLPVPNAAGSHLGYGLTLAAGRVVAADIDAFGLDPISGATVWRFSPQQQFPAERVGFDRITTDVTTVYCGGVWGNVYAVDAASGALKWTSHVTTAPDSMARVFSPVLVGSVLYIGFSDDNTSTGVTTGGVAAIEAASGRLLWSQTLPREPGSNDSDTERVGVTPTRVIAGTYDGFIFGLDRTTGAILDTIPQTALGLAAGTLTGYFKFSLSDTALVVGIATGQMLALDARTLHRILWTTTFDRGSVVDVVTDS